MYLGIMSGADNRSVLEIIHVSIARSPDAYRDMGAEIVEHEYHKSGMDGDAVLGGGGTGRERLRAVRETRAGVRP